MKRPIIKICGNTRLEDASFSLENGADILGFIFYEKSPRYIMPENAKKIIDAVNKKYHYLSAGVFVNPTKEFVTKVIEITGIDILQFHGEEPLSFTQSFDKKVIKAFRIKDESDILKCSGYDPVDYFLLDAFSGNSYGGTGKSFDWNLLVNFKYRDRLFLSGGIGRENVIEAVEKVNPYGLDLSSSIEKFPGIKDHKKINEFFSILNKNLK